MDSEHPIPGNRMPDSLTPIGDDRLRSTKMDEAKKDMAALMAVAVASLESAAEVLDAAESVEQRARSETTTARNKLNDCQKGLDVLIGELRKTAPRQSKWQEDARDRRT